MRREPCIRPKAHWNSTRKRRLSEQEQFEFGQSEFVGEAGEVFGEVFGEGELMEADRGADGNYQRAGGSTISLAISSNERPVPSARQLRSPVGQAIGGVLKAAAKKALPLAGAALGGAVGGPLGAKIGSGLAQAAGGALGLEAEMLSHEDRQYEGGKQFVRFAGETVKNAVTNPASPDPRAAAQSAVVRAAQALAPGLVSSAQAAPAGRHVAGRWVRRGTPAWSSSTLDRQARPGAIAMHDIDRTFMEYNPETEAYETGELRIRRNAMGRRKR